MRNGDFDSSSVELAPVQAPDAVHPMNENCAANLPYDPGRGWLALTGVLFSLLSGVMLTVYGIIIFLIKQDHFLRTPWRGSVTTTPIQTEVIPLLLVGIVTACTEATGYVHGTALKWALAKQGRLQFNANLRLLNGSGGVWGINGWLSNAVFSILLILAYTASNLCLKSYPRLEVGPDDTDRDKYGAIFLSSYGLFSIPILFVGIAIFIQSILGLIAFYSTHIPTWSSSPLDVTSALVHIGGVQPRSRRCMQSVAGVMKSPLSATYTPHDSPNSLESPIYPSSIQPSLWMSHPHIRRMVWASWGLVGFTCAWGLITNITYRFNRASPYEAPVLNFRLPSKWGQTMSIGIIGTIQATFTLGLHSCELVVTLLRDESVWRAASSRKGARPAGNPIVTAISSWQSGFLLVAKTLIHWLFGRAIVQSSTQ